MTFPLHATRRAALGALLAPLAAPAVVRAQSPAFLADRSPWSFPSPPAAAAM
jgi:hypothetical protein